jgi:predicted ATPase/DNA-binding SARP family transcriptional activator
MMVAVDESGRQLVRISLLGGFTVSVDDVPVDRAWRLRKAKTLVKLLALEPAHRAHREVLCDQLWPDVDPAAAANNMHQVLHAARRILGADSIVLHDDVVLLDSDSGIVVDIDEFAAGATRGCSTGKVDELQRALELWHGDLLPEDLYEDWAAPHRERLTDLRVAASVRLAEALLEEGRALEAVALLEPVVVERPLDEAVQRAMISALVAAGRRWEGAGAYERLRARLQDELGVPPEKGTTDLYQRLFVGSGSRASVPNNLPNASTSFVGRQRQLRELHAALGRTRLLTLTGPGGAGKTRLAVELAHSRAATGQDPDGVWLIELGGLAEADLVASAVAGTLGLSLQGDPAGAALANQLEDRRLVLLLDNCEHLLAEVALLTAQLLKRCADLLVVTTSREPLALPGELAWRVPSLELPGAKLDQSVDALSRLESVQLFVERARHAVPSFALDDTNGATVADICRGLDGIPLALELAAPRVAHISVDQLHDRLSDVLGLLGRGSGRHPDRQQTLAATLDWSHDLLDDADRKLFRRLAVFAGGFDLDAAIAVSDVPDVMEALGRLVDKSLVVADTSGAVARYRLLEVIRQYAQARLNESEDAPACRRSHLAWYAQLAARHDPDRSGPVVLEPSPWFDVERDNLRAALSTAIQDGPSSALGLATSTWRFFLSRGQIAEALHWLTAGLDASPEPSLTRANALFALGVLHIRRAQVEPLADLGRQIVQVTDAVGDDHAAALALGQEAIFLMMSGDWPGAIRQSTASVVRGGDDPTVLASAKHFDALVALATGDAETGRHSCAAAAHALAQVPAGSSPFFSTLTLCWVLDHGGPLPLLVGEETMVPGRPVGVEQAHGYVTAAAALAERIGGDGQEALRRLEQAEACFRRLGDDYGLAYVINQRAQTLRSLRRLEAAIESFETAEALRRSLRDQRAIAISMSGRSLTEALSGHGVAAREHAHQALSMMERTGDAPGVAIAANNMALVEMVLADPAAAIPHLEHGIEMGGRLTQAHIAGWQHLLLAHLRHGVGDHDGSAAASAVALARFEAFGDRRGAEALQSGCKAGLLIMAEGSPP